MEALSCGHWKDEPWKQKVLLYTLKRIATCGNKRSETMKRELDRVLQCC